MADHALTPTQQRWVFGGAAAVLAAVGITVSVIGPGDDDEPAAAPSPSPSAERTIDPAEVDAWFPWSREEFAAAGAAAEKFAADIASVDPATEEYEDYADRVGAHTISGYAGVMDGEEGDHGLWRVLAADGAWQGRAGVERVTYYDSSTVHLEVGIAAHPADGGQPTEMGSYAVVMRHSEAGTWQVERAEPAAD